MGAEFDPSEYIDQAAKAKQGVERGDQLKEGSGVLAVSQLSFLKARVGGAVYFIAEHEQVSAENPPGVDTDVMGKPLMQHKNGSKITIMEDITLEYGPEKLGRYFRKLMGLPMEGEDEKLRLLINQFTDRAPGMRVQPGRGMLIGYTNKRGEEVTEGKHKGKTFLNYRMKTIDETEGNNAAAINERRAKLGGDAPIPTPKEKK